MKMGILDPRRPTEIIREFEEEEEMEKTLKEAINDPRRPTDIIREFEQEEEYSPVMDKHTPKNRESASFLKQVKQEAPQQPAEILTLPQVGADRRQMYQQDEISLNQMGAEGLEERDDLEDDEDQF